MDKLAQLHLAATADRLERMFRGTVAYNDEQGDVAAAIDALEGNRREGGFYLRQLITQMFAVGNDTPIPLTHKQRVSLYVAAKMLKGEAQAPAPEAQA